MRPFNRKLNLKRVFISLFAAMFKSSSPNSNQMKPAVTSGVCIIFPNNPQWPMLTLHGRIAGKWTARMFNPSTNEKTASFKDSPPSIF